MPTTTLCQSCSRPLDKDEQYGTEKNGLINRDYCSLCYAAGAFTAPEMTLDEMRVLVQQQMEKQHMPSGIIRIAVGVLPQLKRWKRPSS